MSEEFNNLLKDIINSSTYDKKIFSSLLKKVIKAYSHKSRYYHNINHILTMMKFLMQYKDRVNDFNCLLFSILYHDIIYNPLKNNNEIKSAKYAENQLIKLAIDSPAILKIKHYIEKTADHMVIDENEESDLQLFLDFDLAVLGSNRELYKTYLDNIRKEYWMIPESAYKKGRTHVIKNFLETPTLFRTDEFKNKYDEAAIGNLKFELYHLIE